MKSWARPQWTSATDFALDTLLVAPDERIAAPRPLAARAEQDVELLDQADKGGAGQLIALVGVQGRR